MVPDGSSDLVRERIAALRALITPGLYSADLEGSPLLSHPAVLARAGEGATRHARVQVLIAVLEEVIDRQLRANDKIAARMLLALGEWSGRQVTERHRAVAKLRDRNWSWERNYRKQPLEQDLNKILLALDRAGPEPTESTALEVKLADRVNRLSHELVRGLGRRRTAYPLDMSLDELYRAALLVEARVIRYHERGRQGPTLSLESVVETLSQGRSVLLLGEPGAGKSVALYDLVQRSLERGLTPLPVRARDCGEVLGHLRPSGSGDLTDTVLFLDGLDEVTAEREVIALGLSETLRLRPALITSRLFEYEHEWSPLLADTGFDEMYVLLPWRVDIEFDDYLRRLAGAGLLADRTLMHDAVRANEHLSRLVSRPLYARMMTFIGGPAAQDLTHPTALYGEYLSRLARVAETSAGMTDGALRVWQAVAWVAYSSGALAGDAVILGDLADALPADLPERLVHRILDLILDIRTVRNQTVGEFLHYSFFEYLVAAHVCDALIARAEAATIHELLRNDLTREIRHHLVAQLRATPLRDLRVTLVTAYRTARRAVTSSEAQSVCNLLVYLLSRTVGRSESVLLDLLETENDPFLATAILWALCHRGAPGSDRQFFDRLERDAVMRSLCRGYTLYYYGDIERNAGPPYLDEPPFVSCSNTLRTIVDVFERSSSDERVSGLRRAIDLYTFLDILAVRNLAIPAAEVERLRMFHIALRDDDVDARLWNRLAQMILSLQSP